MDLNKKAIEMIEKAKEVKQQYQPEIDKTINNLKSTSEKIINKAKQKLKDISEKSKID